MPLDFSYDPNWKPKGTQKTGTDFSYDPNWTIPKEPEGGAVASFKQSIGAGIKGVGQAAADYLPGVGQDNALKQYGQEVVDANPTAVRSLSDVADKPGTAVAEAVGNAGASVGGMVGARLLGQGITAAAPFTGPAAPIVAGIGQGISWGGPLVMAALPSYGGIRERQMQDDPTRADSSEAKALAAAGAGTVGAIEQRFGPQGWALKALSKEGREKVAQSLVGKSFAGSVGKGMAKGAAVEGAEELVQNPIEQVAAYQDPTTSENLQETAFGGVMGALGGGVLGGAGGGVSYAAKPAEPAIDPNAGPLSKAAALALPPPGQVAMPMGAEAATQDPSVDFEAQRAAMERNAAREAETQRRTALDPIYAKLIDGAPLTEAEARTVNAQAPDIAQAATMDDPVELFRLIEAERADQQQRIDATAQDQVETREIERMLAEDRQREGFGQMNDFADLLAQEQTDVAQRRDALAARQGVERDSRLESIGNEIEANRQREAEQARRTLLDEILADPETRNPLPRYESALKKAGYTQRRATPEERELIARRQDAAAALSQDYAPEVEPAAPNEMDASALGIRERAPKVQQPQQAPAEKPAKAAFPMTQTGAQRIAAEKSQATGQAFEVVPHPTVKGRFAVQAVGQSESPQPPAESPQFAPAAGDQVPDAGKMVAPVAAANTSLERVTETPENVQVAPFDQEPIKNESRANAGVAPQSGEMGAVRSNADQEIPTPATAQAIEAQPAAPQEAAAVTQQDQGAPQGEVTEPGQEAGRTLETRPSKLGAVAAHRALRKAYPDANLEVVQQGDGWAVVDRTDDPFTDSPANTAEHALSRLAQLQGMANAAGWSERGGKLLREDGDQGEVTGRTQWVPTEAWFAGKPAGVTEQHMRSAVEKIASGRGILTKPERDGLAYMQDALREFESQAQQGQNEQAARLAELDALVEEAAADLTETEVEAIRERLAMQMENATQEDYLQAVKDEIDAQARNNREAQQVDARGTGVRDAEGSREGRGEASAAPDEGFRLEKQTKQDLAARVAALETAERERQDEQKAADDKAKADAERGSFTLTGSDRAADVQAAQGQGGLFEPRVEQRTKHDDYTQDLFANPVPAAPAMRTAAGVEPDPAENRNLFAAGLVPGARFATVAGPRQVAELKTAFERVESAAQAAHTLAGLRKNPQEHFAVLVLDAERRPLAVLQLFAGATTQASVYPEVVTKAVYEVPGAAHIWYAHNHPSGNAEPSNADALLTRALSQAFGEGTGVTVDGHAIIAGSRAIALDEEGFAVGSAFNIPPGLRRHTIKITERKFTKVGTLGAKITSPVQAKTEIPRHAEGKTGIVFANAQNAPVAFLPLSVQQMQTLRDGKEQSGARILFGAVARSNASAAFVNFADHEIPAETESAVRNLYEALVGRDIRLLDAFQHQRSYAERGKVQGNGSGGVFFSFAGKSAQTADERRASAPAPANAAPAGITATAFVRLVNDRFPRLAPAVRTMLERGMRGAKGGAVIINGASEAEIARVFASKTGRSYDEALREIRGDNQFYSDAGDIQGFYDPESGLLFMVGPKLTADTAPAVLLHEVTHSQRRADIDARSLQLIERRDRIPMRKEVRAFLDRVARRMEKAGETGNANEATAYIVEEAISNGRTADGERIAGFSAVDGKFLDWVDTTFSKRIGDIVRDFVAMVRAWGLRHGAPIRNLTVDDLVALAQLGVKRAAKGEVVTENARASTQFSRTESVAGRAGEVLADVLKRPGVFGPLARTLQTQYHKSTKNPLFKAVWTRSHAMFMDSSRAMSRPAELAPNLLPKFDLSNMGDAAKAVFGRGQTERADLKAVADVLSAGTLYDGAGPMNGLVFTDQHLRDGVKVGERFVKLTDKQIGLYKQARAAIDASLDEAAAGEAWALLRRHTDSAELREWIAQNPQDANRAIVDALDGVLEQAQERLEDLKLRESQSTGDAAEKAAKDVARQESQIADLKDTQGRITAIFEKAGALKKAGYMPLMRFGQYRIAVTSDEGGKKSVEYVSRYESTFEANRARRQLLQDFPAAEGFTVGEVEVTNPDQWKMFQGVNPETLMLFAKESGIEVDDVMQTWYKEATSSRSAMRRMVHRKGYQGFSDDLPRVLASFITSNGKRVGYAYHLADMQKMLQDEAMPGDVQQEAQKLLETITEPTDKGGNVRGLMATWYLLGSAASAMVNATQTVTMSLPFLSQFGKNGFAPGEAMGHLARAYSMAFGKIKDAELAAAVKRAEEAGIVDSNEVFHLYAESMKPLIAKLGSGGLAYRARAFMTLWGAPFAIVEKLNRKSTFIAAYNIAKSQGKISKEAFEFGERAVVETQGVYAKHNRPNWARGNVGGAVLVFRQYSIAYLELAARMWQSGPEGKKAAALMLGILFATAGLAGMPGEDDLLDLIDTFSQVFFGKATISKMELRNGLHDLLGKELGEFVNSGVSAFLPLDVSGRMGMGNLIPGTAAFKPSEANKEREALEVLGVPGSFVLSAINGAQLLMEGNGTGAAKAFAPKAVQDVVKGVEMLNTGEARDMAGRKVVDVDVGDAIVQMIGFNPTVKAEAGRKAFEVNELIAYNKRMESEIVGKMARGVADRDPDAVRSAQEELADWNRTNPDAPILINARQVQHRIRQLQMERSGRIVKLAPPELRRRVAEALEE